MKCVNQLIENEVWKTLEVKKMPVAFSSFDSENFVNCQFTAFKCRFIVNLMKLIQIIFKSTLLTSKVNSLEYH
jgi:hypothetical protein